MQLPQLLLLLLVALGLSIPTAAQFAPGGIGGSDSGEGSNEGATGADGSDGPPVNNGAFDLPPSSTGSGFGWQLPDYPPQNVTWKQGECQFVPKWPGPRCPAGYECMSDRLSKRMNDGTVQLSYRQEHCVFCAATDFCTNEQKDACKDLEVLTDFETFSLINETAGVGNCSPCKEGQYCPSGASNPFGLAIVNLCAEGWVCPVSDTRERCPVGFFCPYGTKFPLACTVTGTFCPLGSSDYDKPCPGGSYCPNPQTRIECPSGHFCKTGSVVPKKCQAMASCPAGSSAALIVWQGILEVVALYVGFALIYYGVIYLQRRRRKRELALVAKRSEGKEVAELLKSLKSFQNLEIREGFSPRQARIRAETAVLEGAAGAAAADQLRKVKSEQEHQQLLEENFAPAAAATGAAAAATAGGIKEEREPGEKSDDDELQQDKSSGNTSSSRSDAETSAGTADAALGAAAVGAAAAGGAALASQRKSNGAVDPKHVSIVLPAAEQPQQHVQGVPGTPGGNYSVNGAAVSTDGTPLPNSRPLPQPLPLKTGSNGASGGAYGAYAPEDEADSESDDDDEHDDLEGFDPIPCPVTISFDQLGLKLKNGAEILKGVSGVFPHSRLTALMGPSGSGKSTFLNVLCGKATYGTQTGSIFLNGVETALSNFKSLVAFVPQDDVLHGDLTVYENLYYNAMLRLPRSMPSSQKQRIVDDTIRMLGLEAVQHSVVGTPESRGISGGQRKRCVSSSTLLATPSGTIRAGEVRVGTQLVGQTGKPVTVVRRASGVDSVMFRLEYRVASVPSSHTVTADHLVTLRCTQTPSAAMLAGLERAGVTSVLHRGDLVDVQADVLVRLMRERNFRNHFALPLAPLQKHQFKIAAGRELTAEQLAKDTLDEQPTAMLDSIIPVDGAEFTAIEVDSPDKRFVLADSVITHNCNIGIELVAWPTLLFMVSTGARMHKIGLFEQFFPFPFCFCGSSLRVVRCISLIPLP